MTDGIWQRSVTVNDIFFSAGKVGIGLSSPRASLHINGGMRALKGAPGNADASNTGYAFQEDGDSGMFAVPNAYETPFPYMGTDIAFFNNNQERLRIGNNGNIGIGTNNPNALLDVNGTILAQTITNRSTSGPLAITTQSNVAGPGSVYFTMPNGPSLEVAPPPSGTTDWIRVWGGLNGQNPSIDTAHSTGLSLGGAAHQRALNIDKDGRVGIGVAAPRAALDVRGAIIPGDATTTVGCGLGRDNGEGAIRYNYSAHRMEYCNGTQWVGFDGGSCVTRISGYTGIRIGGRCCYEVDLNKPSCPGGDGEWATCAGYALLCE